MAAALADGFGETGLRAAELRDQPAVSLSLFQRRQVFALQVFNERDFQHLGISEHADDDRDFVHPDPLRRAPASLTGNQLEGSLLAAQRPDQQGLEDALLADRLRERVELGIGKATSRLERRRPDELDRHAPLRRQLCWEAALGLAEQDRQAAAELLPFCPLAHRAAVVAARCSISAASRI